MEPLHEIDGADVRGLGPAVGRHHPSAGVDRHREPIRVPIDESADQLRVVDRGGANDDARRARFRESLGRVEVADAPAGLDLHREAVRDLTDRVEVRRRPGA